MVLDLIRHLRAEGCVVDTDIIRLLAQRVVQVQSVFMIVCLFSSRRNVLGSLTKTPLCLPVSGPRVSSCGTSGMFSTLNPLVVENVLCLALQICVWHLRTVPYQHWLISSPTRQFQNILRILRQRHRFPTTQMECWKLPSFLLKMEVPVEDNNWRAEYAAVCADPSNYGIFVPPGAPSAIAEELQLSMVCCTCEVFK